MPIAMTKGARLPEESKDFVTCQICGLQRLDLRKHLIRHRLTESEYATRYPDNRLVAETFLALTAKKPRASRRKSSELTHVRDVIPTVLAQVPDQFVSSPGPGSEAPREEQCD